MWSADYNIIEKKDPSKVAAPTTEELAAEERKGIRNSLHHCVYIDGEHIYKDPATQNQFVLDEDVKQWKPKNVSRSSIVEQPKPAEVYDRLNELFDEKTVQVELTFPKHESFFRAMGEWCNKLARSHRQMFTKKTLKTTTSCGRKLTIPNPFVMEIPKRLKKIPGDAEVPVHKIAKMDGTTNSKLFWKLMTATRRQQDFSFTKCLLINLVLFYFLGLSCALSMAHGHDPLAGIVHWVTPANTIPVEDKSGLNIFCRKSDSKTLTNYFRSATLRIISTAEDIKLIKGYSPLDVYNQYTYSTKWLLWAANLLPWRIRETSFPTFNTSCVGISTSKPYLAQLITRQIDGWSLCTLVAGIGLFFLAPNLSNSTMFFYGSGTCVGALAAALVLLFVVTRMLPKGRGYYLTITALWTVSLYCTSEIWKHIEQLLHEKLPYILVYLTSGALIAFIACYRLGPPQNPKTLDITRWALQIGGLSLIHFSSDLVEVSTTIIVLTLLYYNFSARFLYQLQKHWVRRFPPKAKLLTEEEYMTQATIETKKELENLRQFCSSPSCNSWKLVTRLKDPRRFSGFIEGDSHLSDDEMMEFEMNDDADDDESELFTDDDDSSSETLAKKPILTNGNGNGNFTDDDSDLTD